jgi:hypothetical protein
MVVLHVDDLSVTSYFQHALWIWISPIILHKDVATGFYDIKDKLNIKIK